MKENIEMLSSMFLIVMFIMCPPLLIVYIFMHLIKNAQ